MTASWMVDGPAGAITIDRDSYGIPHIAAATEWDGWFGMGFASAQDRLWQMEYDRRRAAGRWSEVVGPTGLAADILARRLRLQGAAKADVAAMSDETRASFDAYADGVNAFIQSELPLPPEYSLTGMFPEPWESWHSIASFKIRHVLMGTWQYKLAQAILLVRSGAGEFRRLEMRPPRGSVVTLPPGARIGRLYEEAGRDLAEAAGQLGFLAEVEAGSNAWVVHGSRTSTGRPVLCNDSHRMLDVPNVYWQVHLACPGFNVIGGTFPGLPGFPHFGHNGRVAWAITHAGADYQDLYIELFDPRDHHRYRAPGGWRVADHDKELIQVRGQDACRIETWATRHGPIVHGDPRSGHALSLRYTATDRPCRGFEVLRLMLLSESVEELLESQRQWVDPVNNLLTADVAGNIGYLTRGEIPTRSSTAHAQLPVVGWTGEHEWTDTVTFDRMPRSVNPPEGFIASANQAVVNADKPLLGYSFADPFRAERLVEALTSRLEWSPEELVDLQADVLSVAARSWASRFALMSALDGAAEAARHFLSNWDGQLLPDSAAAFLYAFFRRKVARLWLEPLVGREVWEWLASAQIPPTGKMINRWLANIIVGPDQEQIPDQMLEAALESAWRSASACAGVDSTSWRWGGHHRTKPKHTLSATFPERAARWDPPQVGIGGDGDTVQAASYGWQESANFDITGISVFRQVVNLGSLENSKYVIPGGASGVPGSSHYTDQLDRWRHHLLVPMHYSKSRVLAASTDHVELKPRGKKPGMEP